MLNEISSTTIDKLGTLHISFFGICITLLTVLISLILVSKNELIMYSNLIKSGSSDITLGKKSTSCSTYIKIMRNFSKQIGVISIISLIGYIVSWLVTKEFYMIYFGVTVFLYFYTTYLLFKTFYFFWKLTKIK